MIMESVSFFLYSLLNMLFYFSYPDKVNNCDRYFQ
ncbi:hypothetical protein HMPREF9194_01874 [Treponema maltophilum ATCC 51939]|uniref:Uncharacterized protein n=1 Tax=Treponema maltophilum ATCC 51939 TaxID=1125699 RepID=S3KH31_TREMA|nr:hypothetical protein HMPREF9194_01874 [Treponema maltophilum ATCC 51939]